jgi:citronellol/citronellal dehydrogenase
MFSGNFCIDEDVLASEGITDLDQYAFVPGAKKLLTDLFLD